MISTRAIPGVFSNTKVGGTTDLEYFLKANRNVSKRERQNFRKDKILI